MCEVNSVMCEVDLVMCEVDPMMCELDSVMYGNDLCYRTTSGHFDKLPVI